MDYLVWIAAVWLLTNFCDNFSFHSVGHFCTMCMVAMRWINVYAIVCAQYAMFILIFMYKNFLIKLIFFAVHSSGHRSMVAWLILGNISISTYDVFFKSMLIYTSSHFTIWFPVMYRVLPADSSPAAYCTCRTWPFWTHCKKAMGILLDTVS